MSDTDPKFLKRLPRQNDIKEQLLGDIVGVWQQASLSILNTQRIVAKLKNVMKKYNSGKSKELKRGRGNVDQVGLHCLFDICSCKCHILENPAIHHKKLLCSCDVENRILEK